MRTKLPTTTDRELPVRFLDEFVQEWGLEALAEYVQRKLIASDPVEVRGERRWLMALEILIDNADDGYVENFGHVAVEGVSEERARELLTEFVWDEDMEHNVRPTGPAKRVWLNCDNPDGHEEEQRWYPCEPTAPGAREFWRIDCTDYEPYVRTPEGGSR